MTRYEAHIEKDWQKHGLAHLLVARIRDDRSADFGVFLVDVFCLGVKDAFLEPGVPTSELEEFVAKNLPEENRERLHPACAKKLIEGAVAYAECLGFAPHHDFRKARRVLAGIDAALCPTDFTFGLNGRPCYVQGANDSAERVERVLAVLEARCGPDGFARALAPEDDDVDDARAALKMFFDDRPDGSPTFFEFSGLATGMLVCPTELPPIKLLEVLWGAESHVWQDEAEMKDFLDKVGAYWKYLAALIAASVVSAPQTGAEPVPDPIDVFEDDFKSMEHMVPALVLWVRGFLRATEGRPEAWGDALTRADLAPHWRMLRAWADPEGPGNLAFLTGRGHDPTANIHTNLPRAITALARALRPPPRTTA